MGILAEDVARVREATDIVQLISNTVALRKAGRRWQGLCPFHSEKTPSFSVNAEEGLYYCFGCGASGDAITFVRQTEGLDFVACVEVLAARASITLRYDDKGEAAQSGRRQKLADVVAVAVDWYHERLLGDADAGAARGYLRSRGMSGDEVRAFKLGWAPSGWDELSRALRSKASAEVLIDAGLARQNERGGLRDNFHSRVLFPIFDVRGDPVGFGGRILPGADERAGPKYKNTPESPLYAKSRLLYGLNWAKDAIVRARDGEGEVIVCEGYTDVIGLHAAGLPQAVATCGTSLTEDHVRTLARFTKRIVLAFDADAAGSAAAERIYQWESRYELDVLVADLPEGDDPDDLARREPELLREKLAEPELFLDYRLAKAVQGVEQATAQGKVRLADAALATLDEHPNKLVREQKFDEHLMRVADACKLSSATLRETIARYRAERRAARGGSGGAGSDDRGGVTPSPPADPSIADQVLLLRAHTPEAVPVWVTSRLFESRVNQRIFEALGCGVSLGELQALAGHDVAAATTDSLPASTIAELQAHAGDEVAATVGSLAARKPPENAEVVIGRLVYDAAGRWIEDVTRLASTTDDAEFGRGLAAVQLARSELQSGNWRLEVAERLAELLTPDIPRTGRPSPDPAGSPEDVATRPPEGLLATAEEERFYEDAPVDSGEGEHAAGMPTTEDVRA